MLITARPLEARDMPLEGWALSGTSETQVIVRASGEDVSCVNAPPSERAFAFATSPCRRGSGYLLSFSSCKPTAYSDR
jgi:hypothetical protein